MRKPAKILSIFNKKGGDGKTSISTVLSLQLAVLHNKKVLFVDCDSQMNATVFFIRYINEDIDDNKLRETLEKVSVNNFFQDNNKLKVPILNNLDLIPATKKTDKLIQWLSQQDDNNYIFYNSFKNLLNMYDFIIIDLPPTKSLLTTNTYSCLDCLYLIASLENFSYQGLESIIDDYTERIQSDHCIKKGTIKGLILNKINHTKTKTNKEIKEKLKGIDIIAELPETTCMPRSQNDGKSIMDLENTLISSKKFIKEFKKITTQILNL